MTTTLAAVARDEAFMRIALAEAERARGCTRPNPMVGAVVVRDGEVVATGFHARAGEPHAEVVALRAAGERAQRAEVYVNLEPCSHFGRTPPCSDALIEAGVRRVVAGMIDPNPKVSGRGMQRLRDAGIETRVGVLDAECRALNEAFLVHVTEQRPFVTLKLATSIDGRIATRTRRSRWITGLEARAAVHTLRRDSDAVLVGRNTAIEDDPELTARGLDGEVLDRTPHRFLIDRRLELPVTARVFGHASPVTIFCADGADDHRARSLEEKGAEVVRLPEGPHGLSMRDVLRAVATRDHLSLLVEGGGRLAGQLLDERLVDRLEWFIAPIVLGGEDAVPAFGGQGADDPSTALRGRWGAPERLGEDLRIRVDFRGPSPLDVVAHGARGH